MTSKTVTPPNGLNAGKLVNELTSGVSTLSKPMATPLKLPGFPPEGVTRTLVVTFTCEGENSLVITPLPGVTLSNTTRTKIDEIAAAHVP